MTKLIGFWQALRISCIGHFFLDKIFYMNYTILKDTRIKDFQDEFHHTYPFLKIEFFNRPRAWGDMACRECTCDPDMKLVNQEVIEQYVRPNQTVASLKKLFSDQLHLYPVIFRRNGYEWIDTRETDGLSVSTHNQIGKKSISEYRLNQKADSL
jgi:hypothetical protein